MLYGTVIEYFPKKGFGFIRADRGPDVYFHVLSLGACQRPPLIRPGQPVKYELDPDSTRPKRGGGADRLRSKSEAPSNTTKPHRGEKSSESPQRELRPRAQLVELIDRIPSAVMEEKPATKPHPKARKRKPTWR